MNTGPLKLSDLPTIEEVEERFEQRRNNLRRIGFGNAEEIVKLKNNVTLNFLHEKFELLERKDKELAHKTLRKAVQWGLFIAVVPTLINLRLGKLTNGRIYEMNTLFRFNLRLSFYAFPLFFWTDYFFGAHARISLYLVDKYEDRVDMFLKVKDPKVINPYLEQDALTSKKKVEI